MCSGNIKEQKHTISNKKNNTLQGNRLCKVAKTALSTILLKPLKTFLKESLLVGFTFEKSITAFNS